MGIFKRFFGPRAGASATHGPDTDPSDPVIKPRCTAPAVCPDSELHAPTPDSRPTADPASPEPIHTPVASAQPSGAVSGSNVVHIGAHRSAEEHALRLVRWLREDDMPLGMMDQLGLAHLYVPPEQPRLLKFDEVQEGYAEMCRELSWDPLPWNAVGSKFKRLTGGKKYTGPNHCRVRRYVIPPLAEHRPRNTQSNRNRRAASWPNQKTCGTGSRASGWSRKMVS